MNANPSSLVPEVERLMSSLHLPLIVRQLQAAFDAENARRQRFYDEVTEHYKAEFINGEIIVHSPAQFRHTAVRKHLSILLSTYVQKHNLGWVGDEKVLVLLTRNDYEPDICFFGFEKAQAFTPAQTKFPPPDLAVEVLSPSTQSIDRGLKFNDYAAHGVREYWIIDPEQELIEQYGLRGDSEDGAAYELLIKARSGSLRSEAVPGFEIPVRALFDPQEQMAALKAILA